MSVDAAYQYTTIGIASEFLVELEKQKVKLDLVQKNKLNLWFRSKQGEANKLSDSIEKREGDIDMLVYKLYNLTPEEITIVNRAEEMALWN